MNDLLIDATLATRDLERAYTRVRRTTEDIVRPLAAEDTVIQSMADVSPPKWHLAHVTWFFETFLLSEFEPGYRLHHEQFPFLFNSYYESAGGRVARPRRGVMSRPTLREVLDYRSSIDDAMRRLIRKLGNHERSQDITERIVIGLHHEQQHQELLYMDIKHIFYCNHIQPVYAPEAEDTQRASVPESFAAFSGGLYEFGHAASRTKFAYDNESPEHKVFVPDFELATVPVSNARYLEFIEDGGYADFRHWLSDGWDWVRETGRRAPLYWEELDGEWWQFTLHGSRPVRPEEPVCHVSFFEAAAFAAWSGARLPTEYEWELVARSRSIPDEANLLEAGPLHPQTRPAPGDGPQQLYGDVWEWTESAYLPYPGFTPADGALAEYNGKFMNAQRVLRGGCCVTPRSHIRATYRNFFQAEKQWAFSGFRLAR